MLIVVCGKEHDYGSIDTSPNMNFKAKKDILQHYLCTI